MGAGSTPTARLLPSAVPFSSRILTFSPPAEEVVFSFSADVVDDGLAASELDGAVVVVTFAADSEDEEEVEEEELGCGGGGGTVCAIIVPTLNKAC